MKSTHRFALIDSVDLVWPHGGALCRATVWPEVQFECQAGRTGWVAEDPDEEACASAARSLDNMAWRRYLAGVPESRRAFLEGFRCGRLEALLVLAKCPALFDELAETPSLTCFIAAHATLRGTVGSGWDAINAVYERNGIFGVLDWMGLPSSRQTLAILKSVADPDLPKRLLAPLRSLLWEPDMIHELEQYEVLTGRELEEVCGPVAA